MTRSSISPASTGSTKSVPISGLENTTPAPSAARRLRRLTQPRVTTTRQVEAMPHKAPAQHPEVHHHPLATLKLPVRPLETTRRRHTRPQDRADPPWAVAGVHPKDRRRYPEAPGQQPHTPGDGPSPTRLGPPCHPTPVQTVPAAVRRADTASTCLALGATPFRLLLQPRALGRDSGARRQTAGND